MLRTSLLNHPEYSQKSIGILLLKPLIPKMIHLHVVLVLVPDWSTGGVPKSYKTGTGMEQSLKLPYLYGFCLLFVNDLFDVFIPI